MFKIIILLSTIWCAKSEAARILGVFLMPSFSHHIVFQPVMLELAKRGHEVVVITPITAVYETETHPNLSLIDVHTASTKWRPTASAISESERMNQRKVLFSFMELLVNVTEEQLNSQAVQKLLSNKSERFDLIFYESCVRTAVGFSYFYKAPVIEFSTFAGFYDTYDVMGAVSHRLFYPFVTRQRLYNLTLWEKVTELCKQLYLEYVYMQIRKLENRVTKKIFGPDTPDLNELMTNIDMVFLNVPHIWDFNRPVPPNIIYLGGLQQKPEKELPKDLESYLNSSRNGVIYVSFGSRIEPSLLPPTKLKIITNVLADLPYDVLMKWDTDALPEQPNNVRISKWLPQSDVLRHPKIKLFITQGGLHSTNEAITAGVPLIALPMFSDQWFNSEQYVAHGIGKKLNMETITEAILKEAIEAVIGDQSYRRQLSRLRRIVRDAPQPPLARAVWWAEHVLRHGGAPHLRAAAARLRWPEYYMLDLLLAALAALLAALATLALLVRAVVNKYKQTNTVDKIKVN